MPEPICLRHHGILGWSPYLEGWALSTRIGLLLPLGFAGMPLKSTPELETSTDPIHCNRVLTVSRRLFIGDELSEPNTIQHNS